MPDPKRPTSLPLRIGVVLFSVSVLAGYVIYAQRQMNPETTTPAASTQGTTPLKAQPPEKVAAEFKQADPAAQPPTIIISGSKSYSGSTTVVSGILHLSPTAPATAGSPALAPGGLLELKAPSETPAIPFAISEVAPVPPPEATPRMMIRSTKSAPVFIAPEPVIKAPTPPVMMAPSSKSIAQPIFTTRQISTPAPAQQPTPAASPKVMAPSSKSIDALLFGVPAATPAPKQAPPAAAPPLK